MKVTDIINPVTGTKLNVQRDGIPLLLGVVFLLFLWQGGNALKSWISAQISRAVGASSSAGNGWTNQ